MNKLLIIKKWLYFSIGFIFYIITSFALICLIFAFYVGYHAFVFFIGWFLTLLIAILFICAFKKINKKLRILNGKNSSEDYI